MPATLPARPDSDDIRRSLRASIIDGSYYNAMAACSEFYFSLYAIFLQASQLQLALVITLGPLAGALLQYFSTAMVARLGSRKTFVVACSVVQALAVLGMATVAWMPAQYATVSVVFWVSLYWTGAIGLGPAWSAWMGDLAVARIRYRYFAVRNAICNAVLVGALLAAAGWMYACEGRERLGYTVLFSAGFVLRMISVYYLTLKVEPPFHASASRPYSFAEYLRSLRVTPFGLLCSSMLAVSIALPLWNSFVNRYMKEHLRMSTFIIQMAFALHFVAKSACVGWWSRRSIEWGNRRAMLAVLLAMCVPLPVVVLLPAPVNMLVFYALEGVALCGFEVVQFVSMLKLTEPGIRTLQWSYYNILAWVISLAAASAAGGCFDAAHATGWEPYLLILGLAFVLRCAAVLAARHWLPRDRGVAG